MHTDNHAAHSAQAVNAFASTVGNHIVFGSEQYSPATAAGWQLFTHEMTPAIQQGEEHLLAVRRFCNDTKWRYVDVRRLFVFTEESMEEGAQRVVFEPNDELPGE